jgi:hypothetical protein
MNLFDLGGQFLRVGRAITPPENVINPALAPLPTAIPINQPKVQEKPQEKLPAQDAGKSSTGRNLIFINFSQIFPIMET